MLTLISLSGMLTPIIQSSRFEFERRTIVKKTTVFFTHAREAILPADFLNAEQRASYGQFSGRVGSLAAAACHGLKLPL
ncbi:hypothetical protein [Escherichia coli]|uniref:hypothetical protein n=1 Tax=Escherichia coli TaxID=562 RepID=UPI001329B72A|nr:hypothetical protein [Escherichia coli]MWJ95109.1 hypothetical protein [Escherichia coli]